MPIDWSPRVRARAANVKGGPALLTIIETARERVLAKLQSGRAEKLVTVISTDVLEKIGSDVLTSQFRMLAGEAMAEAVERHWRIGIRASASTRLTGDPVFSASTAFRLVTPTPAASAEGETGGASSDSLTISAATLKRLLAALTAEQRMLLGKLLAETT